MRTKDSSVASPHISIIERKTIRQESRSQQRNSPTNPHRKVSSNNHSDSGSDSNEEEPADTMGMPQDYSLKASSIATSATEYSSSFFPEATFGDSILVKHKNGPITRLGRVELLERIEKILRFAQRRLRKSRVESFFEKKKKKYGNGSSDADILHVQHSDVVLDAILGNGSYNVVYSVKKIKGTLLDPDKIVIKTLRSKLLTDLPMLAACAADLRKEGLLLAALQQVSSSTGKQARRGSSRYLPPDEQQQPAKHNNHIVKVLAWAPTGLSAFANGCHDSFFVVLERLDRTLTDVLKEWKQQEVDVLSKQKNFRKTLRRSMKQTSRSRLISSVKKSLFRSDSQRNLDDSFCENNEIDESFSSYCSITGGSAGGIDPEQVRFWKVRLNLLLDLSGAIAFLHSQRVIHRDLKPDNVGFDLAGNLKVFDFDVARVLPQQSNWGDFRNELFKLTKKVGSPRYMSPEVARGEHYNEKTDVYALGLLAYEVLSLKRPFESLSNNDRVGKGGNVYKDCVQVVVRDKYGVVCPDDDDDTASRNSGNGRRQKRRNSFPFRRPYNDAGNGSSGKISDLFRRSSRSRGSSCSNKQTSNRRNSAKYANIRPLLPVATSHELALQEHHQKLTGRDHRSKSAESVSTYRSSCSSKSNRSHMHCVNDIELETTSVFWTQSLRTTIDRAWSYDIPTRPFASELTHLLKEELQRIEWNMEDFSTIAK